MTRLIWTGGALMCLAGLLLFGFNSYNPNWMRWAAIDALIIGLAAFWALRGAVVRFCQPTWAVVAFFGYAALSLTWSPDWREGVLSLHVMFTLAALFLAVVYLDRSKTAIAVPCVASAAVTLSAAVCV